MRVKYLGDEKEITPLAVEFDHARGLWFVIVVHAGVQERFVLSEVVPVSLLTAPRSTKVAIYQPEHVRYA